MSTLNAQFQDEFEKLLAAEDGAWDGFAFPENLKWPRVIRFPVKVRQSRFDRLSLDRVEFGSTADFSDSIFDNGSALRGVKFGGQAKFDRCRFEGATDFLNVKFLEQTSFHRAEFAGRTVLRANFLQGVNLNEAVFKDSVTFSGWRNVNLRVDAALSLSMAGQIVGVGAGAQSKSTLAARLASALRSIANAVRVLETELKKQYQRVQTKANESVRRLLRRYTRSDRNTEEFRVFAGDCQLQGVVFTKPEQTVFSDVDLSDVYFRGTNLRGVRFQGIRWWQPKLGRNGLRDEIFIRFNTDGPFRFQNLPVLADLCRNVRVALEESRDFEMASDFYVGELEARRARLSGIGRHLFSIPAVYRAVSGYGTSVGIALRMLLWYLILHALATGLLLYDSSTHALNDVLGDSIRRSVQVLIFQSTSFPWHVESAWQFLADTLLRVLGVVQIAMLILAFRSRIKRH